ncbi:MAG: hypothetical protein HY834_00870 [Devosia nanyangense]|uniref:Uncharacterized protein n=1 Tax=Devosia nanyangense TaxID=1228055 RepID=A0A933L0D2_9HYPH|nr:hypothetical protein [Devosia nanyangense]
MGMVVGLGITRLLTGVAGLIQHPKRARVSAIHLLWALSMLVAMVLFWWWEFALYEISDWSFGIFAFLIVYAISLYVMAALLFPDDVDDYDGYEDFFLKRRHWFFAVFGATFLLDVVDTLIKGEPYFDTLGVGYLIQVPIGLILAGIAIWTADRRYHLALVIGQLLYQAWWVSILFYTHT